VSKKDTPDPPLAPVAGGAGGLAPEEKGAWAHRSSRLMRPWQDT
jgi:hypothetical protein